MATYYINADTGNDSTGDGSSSLPWLTISKAHTEAVDGDTIVLQDSTASFSFVNQTFSKNLTFQGEQGDASGAVLDGGGLSVHWDFGQTTITIEKVTFQNVAQSLNPLFVMASGSGAIGDVTFTSCIFKDIELSSGTRTGMFSTSSNWTNKTLTTTFNNCLFNDIKGVSGYASSSIFEIYSGTNSVTNIIGCTFIFLTNSTEKLYKISIVGYGTLNIKNTIFYNGRGSNVDWGGDSYTVENLLSSCFYLIDNTPTLGTGSITSNPLLVDPDNGNFNLQPDSPCGWGTGLLI